MPRKNEALAQTYFTTPDLCPSHAKPARGSINHIFVSRFHRLLIPFVLTAGAVAEVTVPSALCAAEWHIRVQVFVARL